MPDEIPPEPAPETKPPAEPAPPPPEEPGDGGPRNFVVDLGEGFDKALETLRERAAHYYKKGQHTEVRIKFRGKEVARLPLAMLVAVEAATFWWAGPIRLLLANVVGRTFLEVEFINEADNLVASGKTRLLDGELDEALAKFREAIAIDKDLAAAHLNLGIALKLKGERDEAIASFERALALDREGETGKEAQRQLEKMKK